MEIILKSNVDKLGESGEIKDVSDGYARNFLIPKGLAIKATPAGLKQVERQKKQEAIMQEKEKENAQAVAENLSSHSYTVSKKAGDEDKLFGSVSSDDIAEAVRKEGIDIDRKMVLLDEPIKKLGVYQISIKVHPEVTTEVKLWVVKE